MTADDLLDPHLPAEERGAREEAIEFLRGFLADGAKSAQEVYVAAKAQRISETTLRRG